MSSARKKTRPNNVHKKPETRTTYDENCRREREGMGFSAHIRRLILVCDKNNCGAAVVFLFLLPLFNCCAFFSVFMKNFSVRSLACSDSLDLLRANHRVIFAQLFTFDGFVIELTVVRRVVTMLATVETAATAWKTCKSDPFLAYMTAVCLFDARGRRAQW